MTAEATPHGAEPVPTEKKLEDLYALVEGIEVAMFTTRRADGNLVSRPMATQKREPVADFWFVTDGDADKLDELAHDPHVNLSYYRDRTREWVSVSGTARIVRDRAMIHELYQPDWRAWFADQGGERDGGPDDPRLTLLLVDADTVVYMKNDTPRPVVLFEVVKGMVTGKMPDVGSVRAVSRGELERGHAAD
ncbi:MAG TPA: pyridoxamine 5'-phosphate oxidase family protein [Longimicrobium sp.]|nr:pyridoxamine 5'-phosphate oxidase family protein [Longimicrobium sp.]